LGSLVPGKVEIPVGLRPGGIAADPELSEGGKTSAQLATLPGDGPTGGYFHMGEALPW